MYRPQQPYFSSKLSVNVLAMLQWLNKLITKKSDVWQYNHPEIGVVTIRRSSRAKRLSLRVSLTRGVTVTIPPRGISFNTATEFIDKNIAWIKQSQAKIEESAIERPTISKSTIEELRIKAREYLPQRLNQLATSHGFEYRKVTLRKAKSRWGSCSSRNDISLNIMLMQLPHHLIDFVLLHELCHTIHHNHSPQFHALLNQLCNGNEAQLIRELKQHNI